MNILVLGNGAREHAIIEKLSQSGKDNKIYVYPGNDGMRSTAKILNEFDIYGDDITKLKIDLCIPGSEIYLEKGISDICISRNINVFGPVKDSAKLETSKVYAKKFMNKYNIPTADFSVAYDEFEIKEKIKDFPVVLKYDGLASGKGVSVCRNINEVNEYIINIFHKNRFGEKKPIIIEKYLEGKEISVITAISDSEYYIFPTARDYKQIKDNDKGPNTGGMGSVASKGLIDEEDTETIIKEIIKPTITGLLKEKMNYRGFLYFGIKLTEEGPKVLEYNCRFGDPEAQAILPLINGNFSEFLLQAAKGIIDKNLITIKDGYSVCVVIAHKNYPYGTGKGEDIEGLDRVKECNVYYSGTNLKNNRYKAVGGRILSVAGNDKTRIKALEKVYNAVTKINFENMHYRKDIGKLHF